MKELIPTNLANRSQRQFARAQSRPAPERAHAVAVKLVDGAQAGARDD